MATNVEQLYDYLNKLAINRKWRPKTEVSIHMPAHEFIQIDMYEFGLVRKLMKDKGVTYEECATKLSERIIRCLTIDNKIDDFKGIKIKFFDYTNGSNYLTIMIK